MIEQDEQEWIMVETSELESEKEVIAEVDTPTSSFHASKPDPEHSQNMNEHVNSGESFKSFKTVLQNPVSESLLSLSPVEDDNTPDHQETEMKTSYFAEEQQKRSSICPDSGTQPTVSLETNDPGNVSLQRPSFSAQNSLFSLSSQEERDGRLRIGQSRILLPEISKQTLYVEESENLLLHVITPDEVMVNDDLRLRKCRITVENGVPKPEKVILLLGATGAGKTSLVHSMVNYLLGVTWDSKDRIRLETAQCDTVTEPHASCKSQTRWITSYIVEHQPGLQVPYTVHIIDTPGLGDTEGINRDMDICKQLKQFLENEPPFGLEHIDAICYVVKSTENRLNAAMSYSINAILNLFSKEVREVFYLFTTFYDGTRPCALNAVRAANVSYQKNFPINNMAFFMSPQANDNQLSFIQKAHFDASHKSLKEFFDVLTNRFEPPCSLRLTREVLKERQRLQLTVEGIATQIQMRVEELKEINQEKQMLQKFEEEIANNADFTFTVEQTHFDLVPTEGRNVTNCNQCQMTCCEGCTIYYDKLKWFCASIEIFGKCKKCPGKCHWSVHHNPSAKLVPRVEQVLRTYEDMKRKYDLAVEGKRGKEELLSRIQWRLDNIENEVMQMINTARESLKLLNENALRGNSLDAAEYVDMLIADERSQLADGWQDRVEQLIKLKEKIQLNYLIPNPVLPEENAVDRGYLITPSFVHECSNQLPLY